MDNSYKAVLRLIGDIYEASIHPAHWSSVVEQLVHITGSSSGMLVIHDHELRQLRHLHGHGVPRLAMTLLNSGMGSLDPGLRVMREQASGKAMNMYRLDDETKVSRLFYSMTSRLSDLFFFAGVNFFNDEQWHVGVGLHRTREQGEFEDDYLELLDELVPHFQRALRIQKEFTRLQLKQCQLQSELDRHIMGMVLLDTAGRVTYLNPMAERILGYHGAIKLRDDRLSASKSVENEKLQQAIRSAANDANYSASGTQVMGLTHHEHESPLAIMVARSQGGEGGVALYLTDPQNSLPISDDALMSVYGLTRREAEVAVALANGMEQGEIARQKYVSVQTVRSQMKSIFRKTGVNRQADLIRVLLNGPYMR